jgi:DNA-binding MarR family transcriptional regulator
MSTTSMNFGTRVLGQTEKALNAILDRELAGTGLTEPQWIALTLTLTAGGGGSVNRGELAAQLAGALKVSDAAAHTHITDLASAGLVATDGEDSAVTATDAGRQLHARIRGAVTEITERLWGDLPAEDLATAGRVLSTVLDRANLELAPA